MPPPPFMGWGEGRGDAGGLGGSRKGFCFIVLGVYMLVGVSDNVLPGTENLGVRYRPSQSCLSSFGTQKVQKETAQQEEQKRFCSYRAWARRCLIHDRFTF